ncbi:MAG: hypothetical protein JKY37_01675 [Nannocystaceae bacterium]|nr:hypothetical protein [Nannocystaceae bacterium]
MLQPDFVATMPSWSYVALGVAMALLGAAGVRVFAAYLRLKRRSFAK